MDRPLWQILFTLTYSAFVVQRAAVAWVLHPEQRAPILMLLWGVQIAAALATAIGVWIGSRWTAAALLTAGAALVISTLVESLALGMHPLLASSAEILIVVLATGGLTVMLRSRPGGDEHPTSRPQPSGSSPEAGRPSTRS